MIIYYDRSFGSEVCSDAFRCSFPDEYDGEVMCVKGTMKEEKESGDYNIGANPSQEEQSDEVEACVSKEIDICRNHRLHEGTYDFPDKKDFFKYMKKWAKRVSDLILKEAGTPEEGQEKNKKFQTAAKKFFEDLKTNYDSYKFYRVDFVESGAEDFHDLYYVPVMYNDDGGDFTFFYFKQALKEVKF